MLHIVSHRHSPHVRQRESDFTTKRCIFLSCVTPQVTIKGPYIMPGIHIAVILVAYGCNNSSNSHGKENKQRRHSPKHPPMVTPRLDASWISKQTYFHLLTPCMAVKVLGRIYTVTLFVSNCNLKIHEEIQILCFSTLFVFRSCIFKKKTLLGK